MRNTIHNAWVKYVNNLRVNSSKIGVWASTTNGVTTTKLVNRWVKVRVILHFIPSFTQALSTRIIDYFHLLNKTFTHNPQHLLLEPKKKI